jgi:hypothetical protein
MGESVKFSRGRIPKVLPHFSQLLVGAVSTLAKNKNGSIVREKSHNFSNSRTPQILEAMKILDTIMYDKRRRSAGVPKVPNKAANKSSRSRAKTDALHDRYSRQIATSMLNERFAQKCHDRHEARKAYREAKRQAKLAHPRYVLD